ncbi:MAG TPA: calcium/sodium antiporter [Gammaproteobacteria bacterium]
MLLLIVSVVGGLALLVFGADRFVHGASALARNLGVPTLLIGLTIIGVGTSAPEMLVSVMSALGGNPGIAVGNAVGSNIANIGLVAGCCALVMPITVRSPTLKREFPLMFSAAALAWYLLGDARLDRTDGLILLAGFLVVFAFMSLAACRAPADDPIGGEFSESIPAGMPTRTALAWTIAGLLLLLISSRMVVSGAAGIARAMEVSDLVVGLTVVAVGTSLPELAASVASVLKNEPDLAVGNVLGSNMFNMLPVLGLPGVIAPAAIDPAAVFRDFPVMAGFSVALFLMAFGFRGPGRINRVEGATLLFAYLAYQVHVFVSNGG